MEHTVEKLGGSKVKISFVFPADAFEEAVGKAFLKTRGSIPVPGFRKGKAPRKLIENMYGESVFYDEALEILFPEAYRAVLEANDLKPVSSPRLNVEEMGKGKDLLLTCEVFIQPEVELGEYKGVEVVRKMKIVSDADVDGYMRQEQKRVARMLDVVDRPVQNGDRVDVSYSGTVDGEEFEGGAAENETLLVGEDNAFLGMDAHVIGMSVSEARDVQIKLPEDFYLSEHAGKDAQLHIEVNSISCEELPDLDDEFASEVSDFETLKEFQADVKTKLQETADGQSTEAAKHMLVETIVANARLDVPEPMIEEKLDEMMEQMAFRMKQYGLTLERYMKYAEQNIDQMREMRRLEAERSVKTDLVLDEIIRAEELKADDTDVDAMLGEYASADGKTLEELKKELNAGQLRYFAHRSELKQALDLLWDHAVVQDELVTDEVEKNLEEEIQ